MPLIFLLVFLFSIAIAPAAFALDGNGTEDDPYLITSQKDLEDFRNIVNNRTNTGAHAKLTADIELTKSNWTPIGNSSTSSYRYTGTFDGGGYKITGLTITSTSSGYCGLFGCIGTGGKVMNLTLEDVDINVTFLDAIFAGAVAGCSYGGTIEGCTVTGKIYGCSTSLRLRVGGIAGYVRDSSTIKNCINSANVNGESAETPYIGGIAGYVYSNSSLTNCGYLKNGDVNSSISAAGYNLGSQTTNVGTFSDADEVNNIVFKLTPLIDGEEFDEYKTYSMAADGKMIINFKAWPGEFANAYSNEGVYIQANSSDESLALVNTDTLATNSAITVTGQDSPGDVAITVTATLYTYKFSSGSYDDSVLESKDYTVKVELADVPITGISLSASSLTMNLGETQELTVTYAPNDTTQKGVTWTTSDEDENVVKIISSSYTSATIEAVGAGEATITATSTEDYTISAPCEVTVAEAPETPGDEETGGGDNNGDDSGSTESGASGGSGGGGCNAGTGALALLALIPLALRKKR